MKFYILYTLLFVGTSVREMAKRIGILGGISYKATMKYYELIHERYFERYEDYHYPEVVVFSLDFQRFTDLENQSNVEGYVAYIMEGISSLERAGVDFIVMAANSPHAVFDKVQEMSKVSLISIVDVVTQTAEKEGLGSLLLTGIGFTMQSTFYQIACSKLGIEVVTPSEVEQTQINRMIFNELVVGVFREESKRRFLEIIDSYNVDGVILGCTELPLLVSQLDSDIRLMNTLELHVEAALDYSLSWRNR
jgi:aspartate racemase